VRVLCSAAMREAGADVKGARVWAKVVVSETARSVRRGASAVGVAVALRRARGSRARAGTPPRTMRL